MKVQEPAKFFCDTCKKDITVPAPYGRLVIEARAPDFTQAVAGGEFCGIECACKWLNDKLPERLS